MQKTNKFGIILAILAAALYAINTPISKLLLNYMSPTLMAGFLYIGAGMGIGIIAIIRKFNKSERNESKLTKSEIPFTVAMIVLDILAPICLMLGLKYSTAANASLLKNFEIVAIALIALVAQSEHILALEPLALHSFQNKKQV